MLITSKTESNLPSITNKKIYPFLDAMVCRVMFHGQKDLEILFIRAALQF